MNPLQDLTEAYFAAAAALRQPALGQARSVARRILFDLARADVPDRLRCAAAGTIVSLCPASVSAPPPAANVVRLPAAADMGRGWHQGGRPAEQEDLAPCDV